jgi:hypothetical protein
MKRIVRFAGAAILATAFSLAPAWGQARKDAAPAATEEPDAQRTRDGLSRLLDRYPPAVRETLALDPSLLENQAYLAPYPALVSFLTNHPEIAHNPSFYIGERYGRRGLPDRATQVTEMWRDALGGLAAFIGFGMAIGLLVWLIRTIVDYRRWSRLAKVQTDVHTKLLDRFTANDDLLAYIQSPAGSKFLESSPIRLDARPQAVGAPLGRILWSVQGGLVLVAGGIGLELVGARVADEAAQPLHALGVLAIALGLGFVISAVVSFVISQRLGLIERGPTASRTDPAVGETEGRK